MGQRPEVMLLSWIWSASESVRLRRRSMDASTVQYGLLDRLDEEETAGWMGKTIDMFTVAGMINQCAR